MRNKSKNNELRLHPDDVYPGLKVKKLSGKPFMYGGKHGTVIEVIDKSPYNGKPAVQIAEDKSIVSIYMLAPVEPLDF